MRDRIELLEGLMLVLLHEVRDRIPRRQRGQGIVEYLAVVVGVVTAVLVVLATFTTALSDLGTRVASALGGIAPGK